MRIHGQPKHPSIERAHTSSVHAEGSGKAARAEHKKAEAARESVEVSKTSQKLAMARAPETPDAERISRLRAAIADGSFRVDAGAIADRMLSEERG